MESREHKGYHQKLKMLYLAKIFYEETDDQHTLTIKEIIEKLASYGVNADRKTLYTDFEELRGFGLDIITEKEGRNCFYHLGSREFELAELKLLVDSVQAAKFITDKKSKELIGKLELLCSRNEAKELHRQVFISGRIKSMNESVYYSVDKIHEAINSGKQIRFRYYRWNLKKQMEYRKNGAWYQASPWALVCNNNLYYMIAYDEEDKMIKHYRVDKMVQVSVTDERRAGRSVFKQLDMARYTKTLFDMNTGDETSVTIEARNFMLGALIDRFGKDLIVVPIDEEHFRTNVNVTVSLPFLSWIISLGDPVKIVGPEKVVEMMREEIERLRLQYV